MDAKLMISLPEKLLAKLKLRTMQQDANKKASVLCRNTSRRKSSELDKKNITLHVHTMYIRIWMVND